MCRKVTKVSNRSNLVSIGIGLKYYRKSSVVEVEWDTNLSKGKEIIYFIVEIKKYFLNHHIKFSLHLFLT